MLAHASREDGSRLPKQFSKRRWEYFKKNNGLDKELGEAFEGMAEKKGPDTNKKVKAAKGVAEGKEKRQRDRTRKKDYQDDGQSKDGKQGGKKKATAEKEIKSMRGKKTYDKTEKTAFGDAKPTGISADRLSSYTNTTKRKK